MIEGKSYTQQELAEIRLKPTKYLISTFRDLKDLKELKKWTDEQFKENESLINYIEKLRIYSLESGQPELFKKWEKENETSFLGFDSLDELNDKLHIRTCLVCGIHFSSVQKNRKYCSNRCKQMAFQHKKRNITKHLTKKIS